MSKPRPYVTIGAHHRGPHVDALYALAERCGADVLLVDTGYALPAPRPRQELTREPTREPAKRVRYAGYDLNENAHRYHGWSGEARR